MKLWREVLAGILHTRLDSIINIIALALAVLFVPYFWLKIILLPVIAFSFYKVAESIYTLHKEKHIPLAVVIFGDQAMRDSFVNDCLCQMAKLHFDETALRHLGIGRDDWCLYQSGDLPTSTNQWRRVVREFRSKLAFIRAKLEGPEYFHIFLKCRTALVFGLGATTGTWANVVLYQEDSSGSFKPVIHLDNKTNLPNHHATHSIKKRLEPPYEFIHPSIPKELTSPTLVALNLAGHSPGAYVRSEAKRRNLSCVMIDNTYGNNLTEKYWLRPAQEVASVLLQLLAQGIELEIYASCPNALAFAIGMALGDQCPVTLFHWFADKKVYKPVLKLNNLY
jgi:hypothetical protein